MNQWRPDEYWEVNFHATVKMLELLTKHQLHHFIFSSTTAVYGSPDHSNPIKEDDEKNPISPYGALKLAAEAELISSWLFQVITEPHCDSLTSLVLLLQS